MATVILDDGSEIEFQYVGACRWDFRFPGHTIRVMAKGMGQAVILAVKERQARKVQ